MKINIRGIIGLIFAILFLFVGYTFIQIRNHVLPVAEAQQSCNIPNPLSTTYVISLVGSENEIDCSGVDLVITNGGILEVHGAVDPDGSTANDKGMILRVKSLDIQAGGKIDGNGQGYPAGSSETGSAPTASGGTSGSGGGHGGAGAEGVTDGTNPAVTPGAAFGIREAPITLGGAGGQSGTGGLGGSGGGAIKIEASGTVTINGTITMNGADGAVTGNASGGGGAGGSIWVQADTIAGSGSVSAVGGIGSPSGVLRQGGGGGGGRVALVCTNTLSFTGAVSVAGGNSGAQDGQPGSTYGPGCIPVNPTVKVLNASNNVEITPGSNTIATSIKVVGSLVTSPVGRTLQMQVEFRESSASYTGSPTHLTTSQTSPQNCSNPPADCASQTITGLVIGKQYKVRVRAINSDGMTSAWVDYGGNGGYFSVIAPSSAASIEKISGDNQTGAAGTAATDPLVVLVKDQYNNPLPNATVTWSKVNGTVTTYTTTDANGNTQTPFTFGTVAGAASATATISGAGSVTFTHTVVPAAPASLKWLIVPAVALTNQDFTLKIEARDQYNNLATNYSATINIAPYLVDGTTPASATLTPSTMSMVAGVVQITNARYSLQQVIKIKADNGAGVSVLSPSINVVDSLGSCPDIDVDTSQTWDASTVPNGIFDCRGLGTLYVRNGAVLTLTSVSNGDGTINGDYGSTILADDMVIENGGTVSANTRGYSTNGPGSASGSTGAEASHGGYGGAGRTPYGSVFEPTTLGSGGYSSGCYGNGAFTSVGGGAIKIVVTNVMTVDGSIQSNGNNFACSSAAGGSIWLDSSIFRGTGSIQARGAGNAGGGRIAIYYDTDDQSSTLLSTLGTASASVTAYGYGPGTIYVEHKGVDAHKQAKLYVRNNQNISWAGIVKSKETNITEWVFSEINLTNYGHLIVLENDSVLAVSDDETIIGDSTISQLRIDGTLNYSGNTAFTIDNNYHLSINGRLLLSNNQDVTVGGTAIGQLMLRASTWYYNNSVLHTYGTFTVNSNGTTYLLPNATGTVANDYPLTLQTTNLIVNTGGNINSDSRGYSTNGPGSYSTSTSAHGSFGGYGASGVAPYGSVFFPTMSGSGGYSGGCYGGPATSHTGGGAIKFSTTLFEVNGTVSSSGASQNCSSSSGGSIFIDTTIIRGGGVIRANGTTSSGGGRIAIYYETDDQSSALLSTLGTPSPLVTAYGYGPGTIYVEQKGVDTAKQGKLYVRNNQSGSYAGIIMSVEGISAFEFSKIDLKNYGHLRLLEQTSNIIVDDGNDIIGDSTVSILQPQGTFTFTGAGQFVINTQYHLDAVGKLAFTQVSEVSVGSGAIGKLTLYANTWYYNDTNRHNYDNFYIHELGTVTLVPYASGTVANDYPFTLETNELIIDAGGNLNSDARGYSSNGPGSQNVQSNAYGSYGGYGYSSKLPYGSMYNPILSGSGGYTGQHNPYSAFTSTGGGAMRLIATNVTVNGTISSNGNGYGVSSGSGGGILVQTDIFRGTGTITANAGASYYTYGGGGRIAIYYETNDQATPLIANLGTANTKITAYGYGAGTIYVEEVNVDTPKQGKLFVRNDRNLGYAGVIPANEGLEEVALSKVSMTNYGHLRVFDTTKTFLLPQSDSILGDSTASQLNVEGTLKYTGSSALLVSGNTLDVGKYDFTNAADITLGGADPGALILRANTWWYNKTRQYFWSNITLNANASINMVPYNTRSPASGNDYGVTLSADNMNLAAGSRIHSNQMGYDSEGPGGVTSGVGTHGGDGNSKNGYDSVFEPSMFGSGTTVQSFCDYAGAGGGAFKLVANQVMTLNGTLEALGGTAWRCNRSSGGSIWVDTNILRGSGYISVLGGSNEGGGRVAIYYQTDDQNSDILSNIIGRVNASSSQTGGGTVYVEQKGVDQPKQGTIYAHSGNGYATVNPAYENGMTTFHFNKIDVTTGNFKLVGTSNTLEIKSGSEVRGSSNYRIINTEGTLKYSGEADLEVSGAKLLSGKYDFVTNNNITLGGTLPGALLLYAETWWYNSSRVPEFGTVTLKNVPSGSNNSHIFMYNRVGSSMADSYGAVMNTTNLTLEPNTYISSKGGGFLYGPGVGYTDYYNFRAATHGGYGHNNSLNTSYGDIYEPKTLGSGGYAYNSTSCYYQYGGGALKLVISGTLNNAGIIRADGSDATCVAGGAGGSIWVDAQILQGAGTINANGGNYAGGGRVAIYYQNDQSSMLSSMGTASAKVTANGGGSNGGAGTVYIENKGVDESKVGNLYIGGNNAGGIAGDFDAKTWKFKNVYVGKNVIVPTKTNVLGVLPDKSLPSAHVIPPSITDMLGYWRMEETSGAGHYVLDTSGNERHAKPFTGPGEGKFGSGLFLDNINRHLGFSEITLPAQWSMSLWIKFPMRNSTRAASENYRGIMGRSGAGNYPLLIMPDGRFVIAAQGGSTTYFNADADTISAGWHHITTVTTATQTILYIDGVEDSRISARVTLPLSRIGSPWDGYDYAPGLLDDLVLVNRALDPSEVVSLSQAEAGTIIQQSEMLAYWKFEEYYGSGAYFLDSSGNSRNATPMTAVASPISSVPGKWGNTIVLDDTNRSLDLASPITLPAQWSISSWVEFPLRTSGGGWRTLFSGSGGHVVLVDSSGVIGYYMSSFVNTGYNINNISPGWHNLVIVANASQMIFYVDTNVIGTIGSKYTGTFGSIGYSPAAYGPGKIDEVILFNKALSIDEIRALYLGLTNDEFVANKPAIGTGVIFDVKESFVLDTGAKINGKGVGFVTAQGPSAGGNGVGNTGGAGGAHGGNSGGGQADGVNTPPVGSTKYGDQYFPYTIGSGGGKGGTGANGGTGGGAVAILSKTGNVDIKGTIDMSGANGLTGSPGGGGGSGGSIFIYANTCNITGTLTAQGGNGGDDASYDGGGGGGGRISIIYLSGPCSVTGSVSVAPGTGATAQPAQEGTYVPGVSLPFPPDFKEQYSTEE